MHNSWYSLPTRSWNQPTSFSSSRHYRDISQDFVEKFTSINQMGISYLGHLYQPDALCTVHLHQPSLNKVYEAIGHANFIKTLYDLGISVIKYYSQIVTSQPVGENSVLITFHGLVEINNRNYQTISTMIVNLVDGSPKISNYCLEIFYG